MSKLNFTDIFIIITSVLSITAATLIGAVWGRECLRNDFMKAGIAQVEINGEKVYVIDPSLTNHIQTISFPEAK